MVAATLVSSHGETESEDPDAALSPAFGHEPLMAGASPARYVVYSVSEFTSLSGIWPMNDDWQSGSNLCYTTQTKQRNWDRTG